MTHSPLEIEIAIHYMTAGTHPYRDEGAPAVKEAIRRMVDHGLLAQQWTDSIGYTGFYSATDGLRLWLVELCKVEWPVKTWTFDNNLFEREVASILVGEVDGFNGRLSKIMNGRGWRMERQGGAYLLFVYPGTTFPDSDYDAVKAMLPVGSTLTINYNLGANT